MKFSNIIILLIIFISVTSNFAQDAAQSKVEETAFYIPPLTDRDHRFYQALVKVNFSATQKKGQQVEALDVQICDTGPLNKKPSDPKPAEDVCSEDKKIPPVPVPTPASSATDHAADAKASDALLYTMTYELGNEILKTSDEYEVRLYSSGFLLKKFPLTRLSADFTLHSDNIMCDGDISFVLKGGMKKPLASDVSSDSATNKMLADRFWDPILYYFSTGSLKDKINVKTPSVKNGAPKKDDASAPTGKDIPDIESIRLIPYYPEDVKEDGGDSAALCIQFKEKPSSDVFNISLEFNDSDGPVPFNLGEPLKGENLSWSGTSAQARNVDLPKDPEKRDLERNLDLGLSYTSAVDIDKTTHKKSRTSNGILDIRLAPIANTVRYKGGPWVRKWTPIFLNANVATGEIAKSTLSLNRVIVETEGSFSFVPNFKSTGLSNTEVDSLNFYRFTLKASHASDRDFKQKEITGTTEFQPFWAKLNSPREITGDHADDKVLGVAIIPLVGFQFGKTYSRRNPAAAISESDFIKRLYGGLDMKFAITSHFSLSITDTLYGRYELKPHHTRNYFKGEIYAPLGSPFKKTTNGLFFTFEKGDAPPFTSTVNVLKFGYRIQSDGWGSNQ